MSGAGHLFGIVQTIDFGCSPLTGPVQTVHSLNWNCQNRKVARVSILNPATTQQNVPASTVVDKLILGTT